MYFVTKVYLRTIFEFIIKFIGIYGGDQINILVALSSVYLSMHIYRNIWFTNCAYYVLGIEPT